MSTRSSTANMSPAELRRIMEAQDEYIRELEGRNRELDETSRSLIAQIQDNQDVARDATSAVMRIREMTSDLERSQHEAENMQRESELLRSENERLRLTVEERQKNYEEERSQFHQEIASLTRQLERDQTLWREEKAMLEHALSDKQNVIDRLDAALDQFHTTASRELQSVSHEQISREEALRRALRESQLQHEETKEELLRYKETATKTQNELMFELTELRRIFADKDSQFSLERNRLQDEIRRVGQVLEKERQLLFEERNISSFDMQVVQKSHSEKIALLQARIRDLEQQIRSSERVIEGERHNVDEQTRRKEEEHARETEFFREQIRMLTRESESEQKQHTQALQNVEEKNKNFRERLEARIRELAEEVDEAQERERELVQERIQLQREHTDELEKYVLKIKEVESELVSVQGINAQLVKLGQKREEGLVEQVRVCEDENSRLLSEMSNLSHTLVELEASKNKLLNDLDNAPIDSSKVAAGSLPRKDLVHRLREEVNMLRESLSRVESMNSERSQQVIDLSSQLRSLREEYAEFQSRYESDTRGLLDQYDRLKVEYVSVLETLSTYNADSTTHASEYIRKETAKWSSEMCSVVSSLRKSYVDGFEDEIHRKDVALKKAEESVALVETFKREMSATLEQNNVTISSLDLQIQHLMAETESMRKSLEYERDANRKLRLSIDKSGKERNNRIEQLEEQLHRALETSSSWEEIAQERLVDLQKLSKETAERMMEIPKEWKSSLDLLSEEIRSLVQNMKKLAASIREPGSDVNGMSPKEFRVTIQSLKDRVDELLGNLTVAEKEKSAVVSSLLAENERLQREIDVLRSCLKSLDAGSKHEEQEYHRLQSELQLSVQRVHQCIQSLRQSEEARDLRLTKLTSYFEEEEPSALREISILMDQLSDALSSSTLFLNISAGDTPEKSTNQVLSSHETPKSREKRAIPMVESKKNLQRKLLASEELVRTLERENSRIVREMNRLESEIKATKASCAEEVKKVRKEMLSQQQASRERYHAVSEDRKRLKDELQSISDLNQQEVSRITERFEKRIAAAVQRADEAEERCQQERTHFHELIRELREKENLRSSSAAEDHRQWTEISSIVSEMESVRAQQWVSEREALLRVQEQLECQLEEDRRVLEQERTHTRKEIERLSIVIQELENARRQDKERFDEERAELEEQLKKFSHAMTEDERESDVRLAEMQFSTDERIQELKLENAKLHSLIDSLRSTMQSKDLESYRELKEMQSAFREFFDSDLTTSKLGMEDPLPTSTPNRSRSVSLTPVGTGRVSSPIRISGRLDSSVSEQGDSDHTPSHLKEIGVFSTSVGGTTPTSTAGSSPRRGSSIRDLVSRRLDGLSSPSR